MASFFSFWEYPRREISNTGHHFITICTRNRMPYFGSIINGHVDLTVVGKIAEFEFRKMVNNDQGAFLEDWVIMPNHVHALFGPFSGDHTVAIRRFKTGVKSWTNLCGFDFQWQIRFHGYFVRDELELRRIRWYIRKNPVVWKSDTLNRENPLNLPKPRLWAIGDRR